MWCVPDLCVLPDSDLRTNNETMFRFRSNSWKMDLGKNSRWNKLVLTERFQLNEIFLTWRSRELCFKIIHTNLRKIANKPAPLLYIDTALLVHTEILPSYYNTVMQCLLPGAFESFIIILSSKWLISKAARHKPKLKCSCKICSKIKL